jgi:Arc/MetJ-type ribon-helix-helix transcriptional regulator
VSTKERLSASVDAELIAAAQDAVAGGKAESVSAWVNDALRLKAEQDRKLDSLKEFIAAFEAEHGEITEQEMADAARKARARAVVVRGRPASGADGVLPERGAA